MGRAGWLVTVGALVLALAAGISMASGLQFPHRATKAAAVARGRPTRPTRTPAAIGRQRAIRVVPPPDPAAVHANELGLVPVMMYHRIVAHPDSVYDQTPQHFAAELARLYRDRFRPLRLSDLLAGRIDLPAGTHPVVLTFDDGTTGQFSLDASGHPRPDTAVAILDAFAATHPGFDPAATFFINRRPFATSNRVALRWLVAHGFDLGDHTLTHVDLGTVSAAEVGQQLVGELRLITTALPGYRVTSVALPYGVMPSPARLAYRGRAAGTNYNFAGVLLVGANPAPSPYSAAFRPEALPRIRSGTPLDGHLVDTAPWWLTYLEQHPAQVYTSDGDPHRISFPRAEARQLAPRYQAEANPY